MEEKETYRKYFDIDPEYLDQINEAEIESHPDLWKKFYPHETFVKLIKDTISVITRNQKKSIWVEGAYGTGKSHAVLTLKKLLDASEEDTKAYFDKYQGELDKDLYNKFQQIKSGDQKILTVHRYGSSNINGDNDLVFAIQESIVNALNKAGFHEHGESALKDSAVAWLSDSLNKNYFNALIQEKYADLFAGDDVDSIIRKLNEYEAQIQQPLISKAMQDLMRKIMKVGSEQHFTALTLSTTSLLNWINSIIEKNNLKAIVFIWDEFSDYFRKNQRAMTGLQEIVDFSGDKPFYLIIVTHNVMHLFPDSDKDWRRLKDRFIDPICNIELPENMAFRLMGNAMEENKDSGVQQDWHEIRDDLYDRTHDSRELVKQKAHISDEELKKILPIHPYAALLLKHISSAFDSNQRSMFDFIKNDRGDEIKGFQWFIHTNGPTDENPLLTIDMLWDFFYEKGKEQLSPDIRSILDCFTFSANKNLDNDHQRVLKTVLLLQAISQRVGGSVELFIPNERNLNNAFEGSELENDEAVRIANSMVPDILYKRPMSGGKTQYSALVNTGNSAEIEQHKKEQKGKSTTTLIGEADMQSALFDTSMRGALGLRYMLKCVSQGDFKKTINELMAEENSFGNKLLAVAAFARDDAESIALGKAIKEAVADGCYHIVFIDASLAPLGNDRLEQYADAMANSVVNLKQDISLARQYESNAKEALKKWREQVVSGDFIVYTADKPEGERIVGSEQLYNAMFAIDSKRYSEGLETHRDRSVNDTMWQATSLPLGAECGAKEETKGQFRSGNKQTKLENYIGSEAWGHQNYWESAPYTPISKIKVEVEKLIQNAFAADGRVSIAAIYDFLKAKDGKYGFMPCNLTAFVMGFLLKEYTKEYTEQHDSDVTYTYSDGIRNDVLDVARLKDMIAEIIKRQMNQGGRYTDKFIVTTTAEDVAFNDASSLIFDIPRTSCSSVEQTRDFIRQKMKSLSFPILVLKNVLGSAQLQTSTDKLSELIDLYSGIANNGNYGVATTESDLAINIGRLCMENPGAADDLASLVTKGKCMDGMKSYIEQYQGGELIHLAEEIDDKGQYINSLKKKFDADAANWVWNEDTVDKKIDEVILEYRIIAESNKILGKNISFDTTISEWKDKCDKIKVSFLYASNYWGDLSELMGMLAEIKKTGVFLDSSKGKFLQEITANGEAFNQFCNNQIVLFKQACQFQLNGFNDDEIRGIFSLLSGNLFTSEKKDYQKDVDNAVSEYVKEQKTSQLKKLWEVKTGTKSPREWSSKFRTPILCMIKDEDVTVARAAFETMSMKLPDPDSVDKAMKFLQGADFFDRLENSEERDEEFRKKIVKSYSVMLEDLEDVRNYLCNSLQNCEPYDWFGYPEVDRKLREMAEYEYIRSGCSKAMEKIDNMDVADVKQYLKQLIKNNMVVGMEIIKGK